MHPCYIKTKKLQSSYQFNQNGGEKEKTTCREEKEMAEKIGRKEKDELKNREMECLTPYSSFDSYMYNETIYFDTDKNGGQNSVSSILERS